MTPTLRLLSYTAKMVLKRSTIFLILNVFLIWPTITLTFGKDAPSPLYNYIRGGINRFEHEIVKRELYKLKCLPEDEINASLQYSHSIVNHLAQYEELLRGRNLIASEGAPSHTALLMSWSADEAVNISKTSFITARASYYLTYRLCGGFASSLIFCADQLMKSFKTVPAVEECPGRMYRSYNGTCNNEYHPSWGCAFTAYGRLLPPTYRDGIIEPTEKEFIPKLNAAEISDSVLKHSGGSLKDCTLAVASWASFITYDMSHTVSNRMFSNGAPVMCCQGTDWKLAPRHRHPMCMPVVDRNETKCFNYVRSMLAPSEDYRFGPAQQMNTVSHFLDGSDLYGASEGLCKSLRTGFKGQIKVRNVKGHKSLPLLFSPSSHTSLVHGEIRMNVDVTSAIIQTILVNEHNRVAGELALLNKHWDDEKLFQEARRIVIAEIQHITYSEWLPVLLGEKDVNKRGLHVPKSGYGDIYNKDIRASVTNSFANAAMRFVVSLLDEKIILYNEDRTPSGNITLCYSLIEPDMLTDQKKLDSLVRGLTTQSCQSNDLSLPQAVTKYLYSNGNETGFDVLSLDIQRGRDHGLPPYTAYRKMYGLRYETFDDLTSNIPSEMVSTLKKTYEKVNAIDLIVGGLAELPKKGSLLGPVFSNIIAQQMVTTRIGDRYFYDNKDQPHPFSSEQLTEIRKVTLSRLLCDNSRVQRMQPQAFLKSDPLRNKLANCYDSKEIKRLNLNYWKE